MQYRSICVSAKPVRVTEAVALYDPASLCALLRTTARTASSPSRAVIVDSRLLIGSRASR